MPLYSTDRIIEIPRPDGTVGFVSSKAVAAVYSAEQLGKLVTVLELVSGCEVGTTKSVYEMVGELWG